MTTLAVVFAGAVWLAGVLDFVGPGVQSVSGWTALSAIAVRMLVAVVEQLRNRDAREALLRDVLTTAEGHRQPSADTIDPTEKLSALEHTFEAESSELTAIREKLHQGISLSQLDAEFQKLQAEVLEATKKLAEVRRSTMQAATERDEVVEAWILVPGIVASLKREGNLKFWLGLLLSIPLGLFVNWLSG